MSGQHKRKPSSTGATRRVIIRFKQRITKDFKVDNSTPLHPASYTHENLTVVQGAGHQLNSRQNIVTKDDVNSYK